MTDDLDDFDMRPEQGRGGPPYSSASIRRRPVWPWLGGFAVLALAGIGAFVLTRPRPPRAAAEPAAQPSPTVETPRPVATPTPDPSLPALDESDGFVRKLGAGLSAHPEVA